MKVYSVIIKKFSIICIIILLTSSTLMADTLSGILRDDRNRPINGTVVVLEVKKRFIVKDDGVYRLQLPSGRYTVIFSSIGLKTVVRKIRVSGFTVQNIIMARVKLKGKGIVITGEKKDQKVSRRTMTIEEVKNTPASFGDPVNALTSLPGVMKGGGGMFGNFFSLFIGMLEIRGMPSNRNRYYVDGIPLVSPMHLGGVHSVISADMVSEIDLYLSAFPGRYNGPLAGVIDIHTKDKIEKPFTHIDISFLAASVTVAFPLYKGKDACEKKEEDRSGYIMIAAKYGYETLFLPWFYYYFTDDPLEVVPEYWDYQFKLGWQFDANNSIRIFIAGQRDYLRKPPMWSPDPVNRSTDFVNDTMAHSIGITYSYKKTGFVNELLAYASLQIIKSDISTNDPLAAAWITDYYIDAYPLTLSLKDSLTWEWLPGKGTLRAGLQLEAFIFTSQGKASESFNVWDLIGSLISTMNGPSAYINFADPNAFQLSELDLSGSAFLLSGYVDNPFSFDGWKITPGVSFSYLIGAKDVVVDPRLQVSYTIKKSKTTFALAGGMYSSWYEINPAVYQLNPYTLSRATESKPEHAVHSTLGIEQKLLPFVISAEGFFNYYWDLYEIYPHYVNGVLYQGQNTGQAMVWGAEIMIKKPALNKTFDIFGSISYSYLQVSERSNVTGYLYKTDGSGDLVTPNVLFDEHGSEWVRSNREKQHALKAQIGIKYKEHTLTLRFELTTSLPYTPIIGSKLEPDPTPMGYTPRYVPIFSNDLNSAWFPLQHRLDVRYAYKSKFRWGYISWYIEVINVYGTVNQPVDRQEWRYRKPYGSDNPRYTGKNSFSVIPNFGVELKF